MTPDEETNLEITATSWARDSAAPLALRRQDAVCRCAFDVTGADGKLQRLYRCRACVAGLGPDFSSS